MKNYKRSLKFFLIDLEIDMVKTVVCFKALYLGGNANNGSIAGLGNCNTNNDASNANTNIGSRKCF